MSIIHEIHSQPRHVRLLMWGLSSFVVIVAIGFFWFNAIQREMFAAINPDPELQRQFVENQNASSPNLAGVFSQGFEKLTASIGSLFGIDSSKGFDRPAQDDTVHLLPLSN